VRTLAGTLALLLCVAITAGAQFTSVKRRPDPGPMPKNIHGMVSDLRGKPLVSAKVFIRDLKSNVVRTQTTDSQGIYQIFALPPSIDYLVWAEFNGKSSDRRTVSGFLNRQDNVLNFQLDVAVVESGGGSDEVRGPEFKTFDLVRLRASLDIPSGVPAPVPAVLLLHGFGEDRTVWEPFKKQLLNHGWAVIALDLRGHGESTSKDGMPIHAVESWRNNPHELPQDVGPALDFIKSQARLNDRKIVVIGSDVGADLALIASGKFPQVRTVVAINPKLSEALDLAGSSQDFTPRSALIFSNDQDEAAKFKMLLRPPYDFQSRDLPAATSAWVTTASVTDAIFQWLQKTY